ncbi:MAG TPA: 3-oxoacyl-ACP synthase, partial [Flavobacteriaceae bacterium]|nr:3-oxoacyl-ACP synthase [Flavobacteriaceae bacterium]
MTNHFIGIGKYIPTETISNQFFEEHQFYNEQGEILDQNNATISHKLKQITGIEERRYARKDQVTSDLGYMAAAAAITNANIDAETI